MRVLMLSKACIVGIYQPKLEAIAQEGVTLRVLVPPSWRDERGVQPLERVHTQGYDLRVTPIRLNGNFHLHHYPRLGREIADFAPDIVHIDEEPYNLATWQALFHARRVGAKSLFFSWQNILRRYPPPFAWGERWVLRNADYALMGTDSAGEVWRAKGYTGKMRTIPQFGTDTARFVPSPTRPERPFTIGYIGRMVEEKGVFVLLEALRHLQGDWHLRMVGGGDEVDALRARATAWGMAERVTFVGQLPSTQVVNEYHALDVLVLPSLTRPNWKEQFGRVLVEAMACEVPVIASDSGAIPSVVGDGGLIVREGDASALAQALARLQADASVRAQLGKGGRARVLAHFTHEQIARDTVAVYREMLA
jgi:glycosyltransferase involved in cell wall biosynthesis